MPKRCDDDAPKLEIVLNKEDDKYWIHGSDQPIGPYNYKYEAEEDKAGLDRFYRIHMHEKPTYVPPPPKPAPEPTPEPAPKPKRTRKAKQ